MLQDSSQEIVGVGGTQRNAVQSRRFQCDFKGEEVIPSQHFVCYQLFQQ